MVSTISGPIPPHSYYDSQVGDMGSKPAGRTRPEAQDFAKKGQTGSLATLLIDGLCIAPQVRQYSKPEPKDHVKENVRRMRQIQRQTRHRQEEAKKPMRALWKSSNYENVPSKVRDTLEKDPPPSRPQSANFLRAHSRTGYTPPPSRPSTAQPRARSPSVPAAASARELNLMRNDIDFIKVNGRSVRSASTSMRRSPSLTALDDLKKKQEEEGRNYRKGTVPKYLVERQKQWQKEAEERRANEPDPEMPPGHRMMPEAERKQTLQKLYQTQKDLTQELARLPIRTDTVRMRSIKEGLEKKMSEVEEAIKIFSRTKVFVKLDL